VADELDAAAAENVDRAAEQADISVAEALEEALEAAIRESVGAFIIDLSDLDFIETTGLHVLLRARGLLGREDRALAVVCPHGPVRRVFELAGLSELFAIYPSREEAAAALVPAQDPESSSGSSGATG
jgi:anti-sigma B factor antagonist